MNPFKFYFPTVTAVFLILGTAWAAEDRARGKAASGDNDTLFSKPQVYRLQIELSDSVLATLRKAPHQYVRATVREGSRTYADVGLRLKGGTNAPTIDKKPGLSIKFNEFVKDQLFHGHNRILLNHSQSDPTYLSEAIASELFQGAGVPAVKVTFAQVDLNGRALGLYVLAEAINRDFLSQHFKKSKGNLYEGSSADVTDKLEKDSGDNSDDQKDLRALAAAAKEPDAGQRWKKLSGVLDLDRFISFVTAEVIMWHQDGYALAHRSYRIYHDPASDQMTFLPHDCDRFCGKVDGPIFPEWQGLVAKAVLETPYGRAQYSEKLSKLLNGPFKVETIHQRMNELAALVRPALAERDAAALKAFDAALPQLRERVARRAAFVRHELEKLPRGQ